MTKLAEIRHKRGMSQRDLGLKSGVNFITIVRLDSEMKDPRLSTLRALAKALNVKVTELIDE